MGVRGLTKYIQERSDIFFKSFELRDTYLVLDGSSVCCQLYLRSSKSDSIFGGDYDESFKIFKNFFLMLLQCNVTPLVIFDGASEKKKIKTTIQRAVDKVPLLSTCNKGFCSITIVPLFMKQTFVDVLETLGIFYVACDGDADSEIAAVARALNCPVLSYDSDFFIYDVLYIPINTVSLDPIPIKENGNKVKFYVHCSIFHVNHLLEEFKGIDKSMLPIIASLLGNDYINNSVFIKFFHHVHIPKSKKVSFSQRRIHSILQWFERETAESAIKLILSHLKNSKAEKVMALINYSVKEYSSNYVSTFLFSKLNSLPNVKQEEISKIQERKLTICIPPEIGKLFYSGKLHRFIMTIITINCYFTHIQIEQFPSASSHLPALDLIKAIYGIIYNCCLYKKKPLKVYLFIKNKYSIVHLDSNFNDSLKEFNLGHVLKDSAENRLQLFYNIINFNSDDIAVVSMFNSEWSLFIISCIYWLKAVDASITFPHFLALILTAVLNQIVQKNVGYYRSTVTFMKKKKVLMEKLKNNTNLSVPEDVIDFTSLISKVTLYECLIAQKAVIHLRLTTDAIKGKHFNVSAIHLFSCFQSCLYHLNQINTLLNFPLSQIKVCDFYSSTLLFNLFVKMKQKPGFEKVGKNLLSCTPNLEKIYLYLFDNLKKYVTSDIMKTFKKRKKRKTKSSINFETVVAEQSFSESDYGDEDNMYALLRQVSIK